MTNNLNFLYRNFTDVRRRFPANERVPHESHRRSHRIREKHQRQKWKGTSETNTQPPRNIQTRLKHNPSFRSSNSTTRKRWSISWTWSFPSAVSRSSNSCKTAPRPSNTRSRQVRMNKLLISHYFLIPFQFSIFAWPSDAYRSRQQTVHSSLVRLSTGRCSPVRIRVCPSFYVSI